MKIVREGSAEGEMRKRFMCVPKHTREKEDDDTNTRASEFEQKNGKNGMKETKVSGRVCYTRKGKLY